MSGLIEWGLFLGLSAVAVATAAGMILTMSMYRAGLALMTSFVALAGLFILLDADLLAAIQVMMNVGGMLVMILFMVMVMIDPGGEMMWDMKRKMHLPGPGAFSMSMPSGESARQASPLLQNGKGGDGGTAVATTAVATSHTATVEGSTDWTCPMHPEVSEPGPGSCPKCGMPLVPRSELGGNASPIGAAQGLAGRGGDYTCPMHPQVREDRPGQCSICSMDLVPVKEETKLPGGVQKSSQNRVDGAEIYTCPMHPEVRQLEPGTCPKCGMSLVPINKLAADEDMPPGMEGHGTIHMEMDGAADGMHDMDDMSNMEDMETSGMAPMNPSQHRQMMVGMAMSTAQLPWALGIGAATALLLIILLARTAWPLSTAGPTGDATSAVGELLLSRYMIAFEGAAFLILGGIAGAVILARREPTPIIPATMATPLTQPAPSSEAQRSEYGEKQASESGNDSRGILYTCPMHPQVREDRPGQCPICSMDLVPVKESATAAVTAEILPAHYGEQAVDSAHNEHGERT